MNIYKNFHRKSNFPTLNLIFKWKLFSEFIRHKTYHNDSKEKKFIRNPLLIFWWLKYYSAMTTFDHCLIKEIKLFVEWAYFYVTIFSLFNANNLFLREWKRENEEVMGNLHAFLNQILICFNFFRTYNLTVFWILKFCITKKIIEANIASQNFNKYILNL